MKLVEMKLTRNELDTIWRSLENSLFIAKEEEKKDEEFLERLKNAPEDIDTTKLIDIYKKRVENDKDSECRYQVAIDAVVKILSQNFGRD